MYLFVYLQQYYSTCQGSNPFNAANNITSTANANILRVVNSYATNTSGAQTQACVHQLKLYVSNNE